MRSAEGERLAVRLDVLSVALQEVIRALAPAQAAQVADGLRDRVGAMVGPGVLSPAGDEAASAELAQLLRAVPLAPR
jgi:hypothetical protein